MKSNVAIYYNRKIIHTMAGGVAFLTPLIFSSPLIPMLFVLIIAIMLYIFRHKTNMLNWFQTSENLNEISFCLALGISLFVVWIMTEDKYYATLPVLFISIGDSIAGIIRNLILW